MEPEAQYRSASLEGGDRAQTLLLLVALLPLVDEGFAAGENEARHARQLVRGRGVRSRLVLSSAQPAVKRTEGRLTARKSHRRHLQRLANSIGRTLRACRHDLAATDLRGRTQRQPRAEVLDVGEAAQVRTQPGEDLHHGRDLQAVDAREVYARPVGQAAPTPDIRFDSSLSYGDVFALDRLWHELGFNEIAGLLRPARLSFDAEALVRAMVFNRLCDATSKLGLLGWLQTTWLPGVDASEVTHQRLLRTMDALQSQADAVAALVSRLLRPLIDQRLSVVFYDLTTLRAEGLFEQAGDLRRFGLSKEGGVARQCLLSVVQTADGLPIAHRVWGGNVAETSTLATAIEEVTRNYPVQRIILAADRRLLSVDNLSIRPDKI